ncbi:MAG: hypothetical protein SNH73_04985 [Rikenellaceae bacterium]
MLSREITTHSADFCEVKRNKSRISIPLLENKAAEIVKKYAYYEVEYRALSLEDM